MPTSRFGSFSGAANEIVADDIAVLGSIGVVLEVFIAQSAKGSARRYEIVSRNALNKRSDISTEGRAKVQVMANSLADVFAAKVAPQPWAPTAIA